MQWADAIAPSFIDNLPKRNRRAGKQDRLYSAGHRTLYSPIYGPSFSGEELSSHQLQPVRTRTQL